MSQHTAWFGINVNKVFRFVGKGSYLMRYSNAHTEQTHRQLKKFRDYV
jgi:hypothetical protein